MPMTGAPMVVEETPPRPILKTSRYSPKPMAKALRDEELEDFEAQQGNGGEISNNQLEALQIPQEAFGPNAKKMEGKELAKGGLYHQIFKQHCDILKKESPVRSWPLIPEHFQHIFLQAKKKIKNHELLLMRITVMDPKAIF